MRHLLLIAISVISFVAVGVSCRAVTVSSDKTVTTNLAVEASNAEEPRNNNLSYLEPKYLTNWSGTYPASLPPANSRSVSDVLKRIERIIPSGWSISAYGNIITVSRNEEVNFYYRTAMDVRNENVDREERLKRCNCKGKYEFKLLVTELISKSAYARLERENAPCEKMFQDNRPMKMSLEDFLPLHPDCLYKELPAFSGRDYSIFVTKNIFRGFAAYPENAAEEGSQVYRNLRTVFKTYDKDAY